MLEYWYRYRSDLWKKVTIFNPKDDGGRFNPRKPDTDHKRDENIRRAARAIEGYALCNDWQWFGTFTLNPAYRDRKDLDLFHSDFVRYIRNLRRKCSGLQYLLVPELHKNRDGWHMHGLIRGLPAEMLRSFNLREKLPKYIRDKLKAGESVYDWPGYREKFGWVDMEPVRSRDAAARYITKYITKGSDDTAKELEPGKHLYYVSRDLNRPERMEVENAPGQLGAVPEAFPNGLVLGYSYDMKVGEVKFGSVQWYERPRPQR